MKTQTLRSYAKRQEIVSGEVRGLDVVLELANHINVMLGQSLPLQWVPIISANNFSPSGARLNDTRPYSQLFRLIYQF